MFDLTQTRDRMLEAIAASPGALPTIVDPDDPRAASLAEFRLTVSGRARDELFPWLRAAFSRHFSDLSTERLEADVLHPLKKGLGNAEKHGNRGDPSKRIRLEVVATRRGALIAVSDDGPGFDVAAALSRRRRAERYFSHGGSGLRTLEKSEALVSYADGGRTLLICFLRDRIPGRSPTPAERADLGPVADATLMGAALTAALAAERRTAFELCSCRISIPRERGAARELRYVLQLRAGAPPGGEARIALVGRVLSASAARRELAVARRLSQEGFADRGVRVPKPHALPGYPNLVLYEFDPICDLRSHLSSELPPGEIEAVVRRVACGLRLLHGSALPRERVEGREDLLVRWRVTAQRIARTLADGHDGCAVRVERLFGALEERGAALSWGTLVPAHGAFGFDPLWYDGTGLSLYRFDQSRHSHPGIDIGAFLADLLRFYRLRRDRDASCYESLRHRFLATYLGGVSDLRPEELPVFVAGALLLRLERLLRRPQAKWQRKVDRLLEQCERELARVGAIPVELK